MNRTCIPLWTEAIGIQDEQSDRAMVVVVATQNIGILACLATGACTRYWACDMKILMCKSSAPFRSDYKSLKIKFHGMRFLPSARFLSDVRRFNLASRRLMIIRRGGFLPFANPCCC